MKVISSQSGFTEEITPDQSVEKWRLLKEVPPINVTQSDIMATSPGEQQEVNLIDEEEEQEQDPLVKKRKVEVSIVDICHKLVCIAGRRWRKKSEADVKTGAGETGRVKGKLTHVILK